MTLAICCVLYQYVMEDREYGLFGRSDGFCEPCNPSWNLLEFVIRRLLVLIDCELSA